MFVNNCVILNEWKILGTDSDDRLTSAVTSDQGLIILGYWVIFKVTNNLVQGATSSIAK